MDGRMEMIEESLLRPITGLCVTFSVLGTEPFYTAYCRSCVVPTASQSGRELDSRVSWTLGSSSTVAISPLCPACLQTAKDIFHHQGDCHHSGFAVQINIYNSRKNMGRVKGWAHFKQSTEEQVSS